MEYDDDLMMADLEKAHNAGDFDHARRIAEKIKLGRAYTTARQEGNGDEAARLHNIMYENRETPIGVMGRVGLRALTTVPEMVVDAPIQLVNAGWNWATGDDRQVHAPVREFSDAVLKAAKISPDASGALENMATAGISAYLNPSSLLRKWGGGLGSQALGAIGGTGASEIAKDLGFGTGGQLGAGIIGGNLASLGGNAAKSISSGATQVAKSLFSGDEHKKIAARAMYRQLGPDAERVIERLDNPALQAQLVAGSSPITAEIAQSQPLTEITRAIGKSPQAMALGGSNLIPSRVAQSTESMDALLNKHVFKPGVRDNLGKAKTRIFNEFKQGRDLTTTTVPATTITDELARLQTEFEGDSTIGGLIRSTQNNAIGEGDTTNLNRIWNARKELDRTIYAIKKDPLTDPATKDAVSIAEGRVRKVLNNALIIGDPEFKGFLKKYSKVAAADEKFANAERIANKLRTGTPIAASGSEELTGMLGFSPAQAHRMRQKLSNADITEGQRQAFDSIAAEMARRNALTTNLGGLTESPTAAYLARSNLLNDDLVRGVFGESNIPILKPIIENALRLSNKYGITEGLSEDTMRQFINMLKDPQIAASMLKLGRQQHDTRGLMRFLGDSLQGGTAGSTLSIPTYSGQNK